RSRLQTAPIAALALLLVVTSTAAQQAIPSAPQVRAVRQYIKLTWTTLTRSIRDLPRAAPDPKMPTAPDRRWPVYIAADENRTNIERQMSSVLAAPDMRRLEIRVLPADARTVDDPGLLYLPRPYVVPGGRFNEMYGWDSYFIQLGLLRDGE